MVCHYDDTCIAARYTEEGVKKLIHLQIYIFVVDVGHRRPYKSQSISGQAITLF